MADSVTTQQADIKKLLAEREAALAEAKREAEAHEKALAEANSQLKREAEAHEKALAEANSQLKRKARKKALAEAEPFLTTSQWLSVIFIAASLAGF